MGCLNLHKAHARCAMQFKIFMCDYDDDDDDDAQEEEEEEEEEDDDDHLEACNLPMIILELIADILNILNLMS